MAYLSAQQAYTQETIFSIHSSLSLFYHDINSDMIILHSIIILSLHITWKKISRLRIDGVKIDHLNRGVERPFG